MEIRVRLHLSDSDDSNGVKLWAVAEDGSGRRWFKWYENDGIAMCDAENMRLVEETQVSHSGSRYSLNVHRKLYGQLEMAEEVLNTHWHSATPAVGEELIANVLELLPSHPTIEELEQTGDLRDVPAADIRAALHILEERRQVRTGELFGRNMPPQRKP
jgi:hypothetical protein